MAAAEIFTDHFKKLVTHMKNYVDLTTEELCLIEEHFQVASFKKKDMVLTKGQVCRHTAFVTRGSFRTFIVDEQGNEHISRFALEDWWLGDLMSFIDQSPATLNIQALEESVVVRISFEHLEELYFKAPVMERFFRLAYQRSLAHLLVQKSELITESAEERYEKFLNTYPSIGQRVPQYMIASYLGMTPVSLSNIRKKRSPVRPS
ncbi:Crp/Fnr family transcriptional regulator [Dyadobacter aurulentus]|uniref:Crp/Fnr family transcriptional regulator n=1 Tax=Dyadobacter sp. UC 10 TaxID=2605428 RepID=UPI0011F23A48|nr:Crp/Fnr family transcriptional regulator [Dyadobacter sp. UC 10]KAA0992271.1 Crp/Fnr family transcriptional regulator [Dyadobacter sp. UC 10]